MIVYVLAAFGLAYIVGHATISLPFRVWIGGTPSKESLNVSAGMATPVIVPGKPGALGPFGDFLCALIECPACFGFWTGVVSGAFTLVNPPPDIFFSWWSWPIVLGCFTAGSNFVVSRLTRLI